MGEEQKNKSHNDIGEDKGRTEKHYPYSHRERQGKNGKTLPILIYGKTREEQKNITHIHIGKDKGRIEKHYPYSFRENKRGAEKQKLFSYGERQGKDKETEAVFI